MPPVRAFLASSVVALALAALGCGDDDNLPDPTSANVIDTVTIGSLVGTPITTASGYSVTAGAVRTDQTAAFDFAYNIEAGQPVFLPRAALGLPSGTTADPGLQKRSESFDEIEVARSNGYTTDAPVPVALGDVFMVRSQVSCSGLGVPRYAKIEVIGLEGQLVDLKVLANINCGYKGLEPGLPDR
jgi:hypothetical protein